MPEDLIVKKIVKKKYDLFAPNFDEFLFRLFKNASTEQKERTPLDLRASVYNNFTSNSTILSPGQKMWLLSVVFERPVMILVGAKEGDDSVTDLKGLKRAMDGLRGKVKTGALAEDLLAHSEFVLADKDVVDAMGFYRLICSSDIYKLAVPLGDRKTIKNAKFSQHRKAMKWIVAFFANYESNKKRITTDYGIVMPEWYALLYFYDGEKTAASFYHDNFKYSQASSVSNMKKAVASLFDRGILTRRGKASKTMYSLTSKGEDILQTIFEKIIYKF